MAVYSAVFGFAGDACTKVAALGASASSAEIALGPNCVFVIHATGAINVKFGAVGLTAATSSNMLIPANTLVTLDTTNQWNSIRVFNGTGGAVDVYVQPLSRF